MNGLSLVSSGWNSLVSLINSKQRSELHLDETFWPRTLGRMKGDKAIGRAVRDRTRNDNRDIWWSILRQRKEFLPQAIYDQQNHDLWYFQVQGSSKDPYYRIVVMPNGVNPTSEQWERSNSHHIQVDGKMWELFVEGLMVKAQFTDAARMWNWHFMERSTHKFDLGDGGNLSLGTFTFRAEKTPGPWKSAVPSIWDAVKSLV